MPTAKALTVNETRVLRMFGSGRPRKVTDRWPEVDVIVVDDLTTDKFLETMGYEALRITRAGALALRAYEKDTNDDK